jgi:predicted RNA polymerase sigma factor
LAMAIGRLHGRERDALALRFGAELSIGEIAELLDRTPADIKQRLARGVRDLISLGVLPKQSPPRRSAAKRARARGPKEGKAEKGKPGDDGKGDA